jgi:hypothetical protein
MSAPVPADITPQQLLALLTSELSASGSQPINASTAANPDEPNKTLRQAIGEIYWGTQALVDLKGAGSAYGDRPWPPNVPDNLLGQILSLRAEGLITQALLAALAEAAGIDTAKVIEEARAAL